MKRNNKFVIVGALAGLYVLWLFYGALSSHMDMRSHYGRQCRVYYRSSNDGTDVTLGKLKAMTSDWVLVVADTGAEVWIPRDAVRQIIF